MACADKRQTVVSRTQTGQIKVGKRTLTKGKLGESCAHRRSMSVRCSHIVKKTVRRPRAVSFDIQSAGATGVCLGSAAAPEGMDAKF